jgi:hypothetical protein
MTQNDLRLAVHYDLAHPSKPWMVGVKIGPGKLQVLDRYDTKIAAARVYARLLPIFRKHVAPTGT